MTERRTVQMPALDFRADVSNVNHGDRTVDVKWSTGAGVLRRDYLSGVTFLEVLSLEPKHVRLERLNGGAPLLNSHDSDSLSRILGVVVEGSARIAGATDARARLRFSKRPDVEPFYQDVRDGIIKNVSVGYRVHKFEESRGKDGSTVRTAIDWEPYEISLVPMGADAGATLRSAGVMNPCEIVTGIRLDDVAPAPAPVVSARFAHVPHLRCFSDQDVVLIWEQVRDEASAEGKDDLAETMNRVLEVARSW